jgi:high-affinity Fe2+/Pb2+ permease
MTGITVSVGMEEPMSTVEKGKGSGIGLIDAVIVAVAVVGGIFVLLWALRIAAGLFLFAFKMAILVVIVVVIIRVVHLFTRNSD